MAGTGGPGLPDRSAALMAGVAVIGASERRIPWTAWLLDSLAQYGYSHPIWLVNPGYQELLGRPCLPSLDAVPPRSAARSAGSSSSNSRLSSAHAFA